jgi:hypothetical protein
MASFHTLSYTPNNLLIEHYTAGVTDSVVRKFLNEIKFICTPFYRMNLFLSSGDFMLSDSSDLILLLAYFLNTISKDVDPTTYDLHAQLMY